MFTRDCMRAGPVAKLAKPCQIYVVPDHVAGDAMRDALKILAAASVLGMLAAAPALAQGAAPPPPKPEMTESCPGLVAEQTPFSAPAKFRLVALSPDQVRITFVGHATFLIESPQLVRIATDYNDYVKPPVLPDIVTMNHAHTTHYTDHPDPGIKFVLRGWTADGGPARIDMNYKDVRVRNVPTNIRTLRRRHREKRQFHFHFRNRQSVHRPSRPSASHADAAAVERNREARRGAGAGRRQLHARSRRHDRGAARAESTADHPDALFQRLYARPLSRRGCARNGRSKSPKFPSLVVSKSSLPDKAENFSLARSLTVAGLYHRVSGIGLLVVGLRGTHGNLSTTGQRPPLTRRNQCLVVAFSALQISRK